MSTNEAPKPKLTVIASSDAARARLSRVAEEMLGLMEPEIAAKVARTTITFALDHTKHGAFVQGLGGPHDGVGQVAEERVRQQSNDPTEQINIIVLALDERGHVPTDSFKLGHELGHIANGDLLRTTPPTPEERVAIEAAADAFARRHAVWS